MQDLARVMGCDLARVQALDQTVVMVSRLVRVRVMGRSRVVGRALVLVTVTAWECVRGPGLNQAVGIVGTRGDLPAQTVGPVAGRYADRVPGWVRGAAKVSCLGLSAIRCQEFAGCRWAGF